MGSGQYFRMDFLIEDILVILLVFLVFHLCLILLNRFINGLKMHFPLFLEGTL